MGKVAEFICSSNEFALESPRPTMSRNLRFVLLLVLGLAAVTWGASVIVQRTTRSWFDKDLKLRAQLALAAARPALVDRWGNDGEALQRILTNLTHDERIMGASACAADGTLLARTEFYPIEFSCAELAQRIQASGPQIPGEPWTSVERLPEGDVHLSGIEVVDERGSPLGFLVLVHDLSFVARRDAKALQFLLIAFGFLAVAASALTIIASRLSWRSWTNELRRLLSGGGEQRKEFQPFLRDVRELVERIVSEEEADRERGTWTPERLKNTLNLYLHGEKVVILANREPYVHEHAPDGSIKVLHPASGLVSALEPVMRACSGVWIAHGSGGADHETADAGGRIWVPPGEESYCLRRVWLTPEEERGYYSGFANEGLWPLCHLAHARPTFRASDWEHYRAVNQRFADALCEEVDSDDPIVLVQDYHFALAPRLIRERLPRATILMFWHIPWPNSEHFGICPWREELLEGMLGASILGFHTRFHCNNFVDAVDHFLEARIDREQNAVVQGGRRTLVRPYPISVEWPVRWLEEVPPPEECRRSVFEELGLPKDAKLGVGIDRLDYTKGIEERLLAVERLLEQHPDLQGRFTFVQLAAPSRTRIERYQQLNVSIEKLAARINELFGRDDWRPIVLLRQHHEPPAVFRFLRAADVCYVSSLHDGMNLVAKEFVAARSDEQGVLVLSQFTGASRELTEALVVNPYNVDEASAALAAALEMPPPEQRERMKAMRTYLTEFNVYRWAGRMLVDAARLRRQERLTGRLTALPPRAVNGGPSTNGPSASPVAKHAPS